MRNHAIFKNWFSRPQLRQACQLAPIAYESRLFATTQNKTTKEVKYNKYSSAITENEACGGAQAFLYATGLTKENIEWPQIGIVAMDWEGNPCNMHLDKLQNKVKQGMLKQNAKKKETLKLTPRIFHTIGVSDVLTQNNVGMRYSLPSRDLIADSIEMHTQALNNLISTLSVFSFRFKTQKSWYDGLICIAGCDKNMPGCVMALCRLNRPGLMIYGGHIQPGKTTMKQYGGENIDIDSGFMYESYGHYLEGRITWAERQDIVCHACPGFFYFFACLYNNAVSI
ncbi:homeobox protein [Reticulomyxa filosa]|uniref:Homeobox protein n=1 Tax=Reticulomyxa filosa TaxID=46433 RepID=X6PBQ8_RETFI|nr:homeobox protein [Reticulomyxa filosa]|eukprot:ETO35930.1 homeobox protein [Reticulomyxa filosa]